VLGYLPYLMVGPPPSWHQAVIYENMNAYVISSTADVKVIPPILDHQSFFCVA
jgi:hypothetical protein